MIVNAGVRSHVLVRIHRILVGDRRIRVHTLLLPVSDRPEDILASADQQAIVSLLAKMAAERVVMVCILKIFKLKHQLP